MSVTIEDICKRAKASRTAVSRVLNNRPGVKKAKRDRILKVIQELKYTPSAAARNLRQSKTETIGVVFPKFEGAFFSSFLSGVEEITQPRRYHILTATTSGAHLPMEAGLEATLRLIDEKRIDGLILFDPVRSPRQERLLRKFSIPFVIAYRLAKQMNVSSVAIDNFQGAYDATRHLIEHGYKRIATLTGPLLAEDARERLRGYETALRDHFLKVDPALIVNGTFSRDPSVPDFIRHFQKTPWPDAVFAANDEMALGLLQHMRNHGDEKVRATAVAGFDDTELAAYAGLTTVHADVHETGKRAAQILMEMIDSRDRRQPVNKLEVIPARLIVRSSCGCLSSPGKARG
jgi:LacI family transcriptional regulator